MRYALSSESRDLLRGYEKGMKNVLYKHKHKKCEYVRGVQNCAIWCILKCILVKF